MSIAPKTLRAARTVAILLGLYVGLAAAVQAGVLGRADLAILRGVQFSTTRGLDRVMASISFLGTSEVTVPALVLVCFIAGRGQRRLGRWAPIAFAVILTGVELLSKGLITQPGPKLRLHHASDGGVAIITPYAFPSGHMIRTTMLLGLIGLQIGPDRRRRLLTWGCVVLTLVIGFSRVYLDVHWPSDVAGGLLLGLAGLVASLAVWSGRPQGPVRERAPTAGSEQVVGTLLAGSGSLDANGRPTSPRAVGGPTREGRHRTRRRPDP